MDERVGPDFIIAALVIVALSLAITVIALIGPADAATVKPPKASTAQELATAIQTRGFGCEDFTKNDPAGVMKLPNVPVADEGDCTIDTLRATVSVFKTKRYAKDAIAAIPTMICPLAKSFGITRVELVNARNWSVSFASLKPPKSFAKKLGGSRSTVNCS